ncbi:MAG: ABC transporter ATP-binding protein [Pseudomonadota bacterium]
MSRLEVERLSIRYGDTAVVDRVSFTVEPGQSVGLVGESGSGKSQTALAIMGLLPPAASVSGAIRYAGEQLVGAPEARLRELRSRRIAMVFQDPTLSLNPYLRVGRQLAEVLRAPGLKATRPATGKSLRGRIVAALERVGLPDPERQFTSYPHELSGGMRQRVMIAAALLGKPDILIADEPTTALDVTVQAGILALLDELRDETALLLISHDLGIIAGHCERMLVLDQGRLIESNDTLAVFRAPEQARTRALIRAAAADAGSSPPDLPAGQTPVLQVESLDVAYRLPQRQTLRAVRQLGFTLGAGETLAIVGESGSGKSSLAHVLTGLVPPAAGTVRFDGETLSAGVAARTAVQKRGIQLVFQNPVNSLSPTFRTRDILAEPLIVHGIGRIELSARIAGAAASVGLDEALLERHPHELSGGQAQRVAIARALVLEPRVLICDEAVAALDGRIRNSVLDLLRRVQAETGLSIVFISHDLSVVKRIAHRVLVMYLGRAVETGSTSKVFDTPAHPYTRALLAAVPNPDPLDPGGQAVLRGEAPSVLAPPSGCVFRSRCGYARQACSERVPALEALSPGHDSAAACLRLKDPELSGPAKG